MTFDPHVWLDPVLAKKEVENIRDGLMTIDPKVRTRSRIGYTDKMNENIKNLTVELECNQ
jgi:ABC-type Zn uptake system ZnuABC Zn-binding protein ZnuA